MELRREKRRQQMTRKARTSKHSETSLYNTEEFEETGKLSRSNKKKSFSNISNKESSLTPSIREITLHSENIKHCSNADEKGVKSNIIDSNSLVETSHRNDMNSSEDRTLLETNYCPSTNEEGNDDASIVSVELIYCEHCGKSYAPETSKKYCQAFDEEGNPKCLRLKHKKRKAFNSAKVIHSSRKIYFVFIILFNKNFFFVLSDENSE